MSGTAGLAEERQQDGGSLRAFPQPASVRPGQMPNPRASPRCGTGSPETPAAQTHHQHGEGVGSARHPRGLSCHRQGCQATARESCREFSHHQAAFSLQGVQAPGEEHQCRVGRSHPAPTRHQPALAAGHQGQGPRQEWGSFRSTIDHAAGGAQWELMSSFRHTSWALMKMAKCW